MGHWRHSLPTPPQVAMESWPFSHRLIQPPPRSTQRSIAAWLGCRLRIRSVCSRMLGVSDRHLDLRPQPLNWPHMGTMVGRR